MSLASRRVFKAASELAQSISASPKSSPGYCAETQKKLKDFVENGQLGVFAGGKNIGLTPYDGQTTLNYTGPKPPFDQLKVDESYSWLKSPRWRGRPGEVGPLARVLTLYVSGHEPTRELAKMALARLELPLEAMYSKLGRPAAGDEDHRGPDADVAGRSACKHKERRFKRA
jgi:Ni,Fe-hydrogenase I large subunit